MGLKTYFNSAAHQAERDELPLLRTLIERYAEQRPFDGVAVVCGHLLVRNALVMVEALSAGGAQVILSRAHPTPADQEVRSELGRAGVEVHSVEGAVEMGSTYLDVGAVLGRANPPTGAAEITRTGVLHYERMRVPVVSADHSRAKLVEGFFGTGDGFRRAWRQLRPDDPLQGKLVVQFGYGKIGRGVAWRIREAGADLQIVDPDPGARARAEADGFHTLPSEPTSELHSVLAGAGVVIAVTSLPGGVGRSVPAKWLTQGAVLVNLGAEDEFGPDVPDEFILGRRGTPLNFHLSRPTANRYIDPSLAAHLLALEALLTADEDHPPGVHPLPDHMDRWVVHAWRKAHPEEDLTGIAADLGLAP
ncbi:MAG: hypothetical protein R3191_00720 [Anaerolineales bacterium]|nr:hypothetical protein [Anaerolineales bacterium]